MDNKVYYGVDFHKNTSTICAVFQDGTAAEDIITIKTEKLFEHFSNKAPGIIAIEATGGSNNAVMKLRAQGHEVKLVETNQFKAIGINKKKTDHKDSKALAEGLRLNGIPEVHLRSLYSRKLRSLLKTRDHIVQARTSFVNHIRGILREYGTTLPVGIENFWKEAPRAITKLDDELIKQNLESVLNHCQSLKSEELEVEKRLKIHAGNDQRLRLLKSVKGIGNLVAYSLIATVDDIKRFPSAKEFASYLGLTPSISSSANKTFMGSITKSGSEMTRRYLIHGARSWLQSSDKNDPVWQWANKVKSRSGQNKAVVALAHRMARISYALLRDERSYKKSVGKEKDGNIIVEQAS